jgi:predicted nucleic acid-binding Zn ribbon protein
MCGGIMNKERNIITYIKDRWILLLAIIILGILLAINTQAVLVDKPYLQIDDCTNVINHNLKVQTNLMILYSVIFFILGYVINMLRTSLVKK